MRIRQASWSRGMIRASGARGPGFKSRTGPSFFFLSPMISPKIHSSPGKMTFTVLVVSEGNVTTLATWPCEDIFLFCGGKVSRWLHRLSIAGSPTCNQI